MIFHKNKVQFYTILTTRLDRYLNSLRIGAYAYVSIAAKLDRTWNARHTLNSDT